jgi:putative oxidoreductase
LDKVFNFRGAVAQASEAAPHKSVAGNLHVRSAQPGSPIESAPSSRPGIAPSRRCSGSNSGSPAISGASSTGQGRTLFWEFLKNFALGDSLLLITFGTGARAVNHFFTQPAVVQLRSK